MGLVALTGGLFLLGGLANRLRERRAVVFAAATGLATVGYSLIDARSVDQTGTIGYLAVLMLFGGSLALAARRPALSRLRSVAREGILIGLGQGGAYALVLVAFQRAQAGQVAGLRQVSVVICTLVAREALGPRAFWGAVTVAVGPFWLSGNPPRPTTVSAFGYSVSPAVPPTPAAENHRRAP